MSIPRLCLAFTNFALSLKCQVVRPNRNRGTYLKKSFVQST